MIRSMHIRVFEKPETIIKSPLAPHSLVPPYVTFSTTITTIPSFRSAPPQSSSSLPCFPQQPLLKVH